MLVGGLLAERECRAETPGPWKVDAWKQTPGMRWEQQTGPVHALFYDGEMYRGQPTETFAFYASPRTLGLATENETFPAVVLIHGGGGTAFAEWVWLWAQRGYAAIAMDLSGHRPLDPVYDPATGIPVLNQAVKRETRTRLANGGPDQSHAEKFNSIAGEVTEQWPFHAVANVMKAHSLIRSFPEVDAQRTAVTGISWGGYTTCLVASLDDRFRAAVPVYGCGFLHEGESVQKPSIEKLGPLAERWVQTYDPSVWLPQCRVPILFVNGTNDIHYPLDSYQKSYDAVPKNKQMRIEVKMGHSHPAGWAPQEIGLFIDQHCRSGVGLPQFSELRVTESGITCQYAAPAGLKSARLHYTTADGLRSQRDWQSLPVEFDNDRLSVPLPTDKTNTWFLSLTDQRGAMTTTPIQFGSPQSQIRTAALPPSRPKANAAFPRADFPSTKSDWHGFACYEFTVDQKPVRLVVPDTAAPGTPWVWHGEFFGHKPAPDIELLKQGYHIAYMKIPDMLGSPTAVAHWNRFYDVLTKQIGLAKKPALVGLSRGGLYCYNWAAANPDKVACIYADAPVCDFKSWPGGKGTGPGSPRDWELVLKTYGFADEAAALAYDKNPVDNLAPLAKANVPLLHVYGDADEVVPWQENTGLLAERYQQLGGSIILIAKPGVKHHPHGLDDPTPIVEFILRHTRQTE